MSTAIPSPETGFRAFVGVEPRMDKGGVGVEP